MGANIIIKRLSDTNHEEETSRIPRNFIKAIDIDDTSFNSCDHVSYYTGGGVAPHSHEDMEEVFYFVRGTGVLFLDGEEIPVKAGSAVVSPPNTTHEVKNTGDDILQHVVVSVKTDG